MGKAIAIASGKGGVGKTTITANLGIALSQRGHKVLLIDGDIAMANLSMLLGMHSSPITLHDVLLGDSNIIDAIYDGPDGVSFIPSGLSLESYKRVDSTRLEQIIDSIKDQFDFILLDVPAGIEKNVLSAIAAADNVLLITMPNTPSLADVLKIKIVTQRLGAIPLGVIVNFVRGEKGEISDDDIMKMLELPIYGLVPFDDDVRKSFMQEKPLPVIVRKPTAEAVIAIQKIAAKLDGLPVEFKMKKRGGFFNWLFSIFKRKKKPKKIKTKELEKSIPEINQEFIEVKGGKKR